MGFDNLHARAVSFSAEARGRSTLDIWRVRKGQPILPRMARTAIGCVLQSEKVRDTLTAHVARSIGGTAVLGQGSEQLVVEDGESVLKLLVHSISSDRDLVEAKAEQLQTDANHCQAYLGDYWLPTVFECVQLVGKQKFAVVGHQPRLESRHLFSSAADIAPGEETRDIAHRIVSLYEHKGLYPDLIGAKNIASRFDTGALCQVDTISVNEQAQAVVPFGSVEPVGVLISKQLEAWIS
jgi:hypothetical protein